MLLLVGCIHTYSWVQNKRLGIISWGGGGFDNFLKLNRQVVELSRGVEIWSMYPTAIEHGLHFSDILKEILTHTKN